MAFNVDEDEVLAMCEGQVPVPFLVSALLILICESRKATKLALEHGLWMTTDEPTLSDLLTGATGAGAMLRAKPRPQLRVVRGD